MKVLKNDTLNDNSKRIKCTWYLVSIIKPELCVYSKLILFSSIGSSIQPITTVNELKLVIDIYEMCSSLVEKNTQIYVQFV